MNDKIPRIIFNFNDKCLYGCKFCFTPFDHLGLGTIAIWGKILDEIDKLNPDLVSFSGCDPLAYDDFYELLYSYSKRSYINVDSSLLDFNAIKFDSIASKIDSISFPLDDSDTMNERQRFTQSQYRIIFKNISIIQKYGINITAHTLLTPINAEYLDELAEQLIKLNIKNWTIYQFWKYDFITSQERYCLNDKKFLDYCCKIKDKFRNKINIKYELQKKRIDCKFFVSSLGNCYTSGRGDKHIQIGNIFEKDIIVKWKKQCDVAKSQKETNIKIYRECIRGKDEH